MHPHSSPKQKHNNEQDSLRGNVSEVDTEDTMKK